MRYIPALMEEHREKERKVIRQKMRLESELLALNLSQNEHELIIIRLFLDSDYRNLDL